MQDASLKDEATIKQHVPQIRFASVLSGMTMSGAPVGRR
jgi:hypothetical protein